MRTTQTWFERQQGIDAQKTIYFDVTVNRQSNTALNVQVTQYTDSTKKKTLTTGVAGVQYYLTLSNVSDGSTVGIMITLPSSGYSVTQDVYNGHSDVYGTIKAGTYEAKSFSWVNISSSLPYKDTGYSFAYNGVTQVGGTLTLKASAPYQSNTLLQAFYGSVGYSNTMASPYTQSTIASTYVVPSDFITQVMNAWTTSPRAANVIFAYMQQSNPTANPLKTATLTPLEMNNLLNGQNITKTMTNN